MKSCELYDIIASDYKSTNLFLWGMCKHEMLSSGVGVTKPISSVPLFSEFFSVIKKHTLPIEYLVYIWQVSPQLSLLLSES